ncbi:3'-5' exonuclease, partial [Symbiobacterium thermophilum]
GKTLQRARANLEYIIVDEYQDTSRAQEELIQLLVGERTSVTVVGDSDQAIYTFNGADIGNILHFAERILETGSALPVLEPVHLVENYRSSACILDAANRVLDRIHGPGRKQLVPYPGTVDEPVESYRRRNLEVVRVHAGSLDQAAFWAASEIARLVTEEGIEPSDIAVLVRKDTEHAPQGRAVRLALERLGIRAEEQERDPIRSSHVYEVVRDLCGDPDYYGEDIGDMIERIAAGEFRDALGDVTPDEATALLREAQAAGAEFAGEVVDFVFEQGAPDATPASLEGVQVRTIHSAKGLEFRVVFLMYLSDREFPHGAHPDVAEERRLYYVGLTRAQERLYVLGQPGVRNEDFFGAIDGSGVVTVHVEPWRDRSPSSEEAVDDETLRLIQEARRRQHDMFLRRP